MVWRSVDSVWSLLAQLSTVTHRRSWRWQSTLQRSSSRGGQQTSQAATTSSTNLWRRPNAVRSLSTLPNRSHSVLVRTDADRKSCRCSCQTMRVQSKCSPCSLKTQKQYTEIEQLLNRQLPAARDGHAQNARQAAESWHDNVAAKLSRAREVVGAANSKTEASRGNLDVRASMHLQNISGYPHHAVEPPLCACFLPHAPLLTRSFSCFSRAHCSVSGRGQGRKPK